MALRWLTLLAAVAPLGCRPPAQELRMPAEPAVRGHEVMSFAGEGDVRLFAQAWHPAREPRAALVVVHGLKDHSSRYGELAARLTAHGIAVYGFDLRGHGRSAGRRVEVDAFDEYLADLHRFVRLVRERQPGRPIYLFGHSMGGAIATLYAVTEGRGELAGLVLSGPALELPLLPLTVAVTDLVGDLVPNLPGLVLPNEDFSRSLEVVAALERDPLVHQGAGPAHTAAELLRGIARIWHRVHRLDVPLLLLHGTADRLTHPRGSRKLHARAPSSDKRIELFSGYYHDLLHEPGRARVLGLIVEWIDARAPSPGEPSGDHRAHPGSGGS